MSGYTLHDIQDPDWENYATPGNGVMLTQSEFKQAVEQKESIKYKREFSCKGGKILPVMIIIHPKLDKRQKVEAVYIFFFDYSDQYENEKDLLEAKELAEHYLDIAKSIIVSIDLEGKVVLINQMGLDVLGYTYEEIIGKEWFALCIPPEICDHMRAIFHEIKGSLKSYDTYDNEVITKSGERRLISWKNTFITNRDNKISEILSSGSDVTDLREAYTQLQHSRDQFQEAMDASHDGIWDWDMLTNDTYYSPGWKRMLGYEDDELENLFSVWEELINPADMEKTWYELNKTINKENEQFYIVFQMKHKEGHWVEILSRGKATFDEQGKAIRLIGTHTDITRRKIYEKEQKVLQEQLLQMQKMDSIGRLAGGIAHDFNNMLSVIIGHVDIAINKIAPDDPLHIHLQEIKNASGRSADLTKQLLAFARKQAIDPQIIVMNDEIESILSMLKRLESERIRITWKPTEGMAPLKIDPTQLDQILTNLVVNASHAIDGNGEITISTESIHIDDTSQSVFSTEVQGIYNILCISDTGKGMSTTEQTHIFEPFYTTKRLGEGTGLGLSTVYGIVKQNGGFIQIFSEINKGTTFKLFFPINKGSNRKNRNTALKELPKKRGDEVILLVEDEPTILNLEKHILKRLDLQVLEAANPDEALAIAENQRIDLLITDVILPGMNGKEVADHVTAKYPECKVLFLSGYTSDVITHQGINTDGVNFLQKPFTVSGFTHMVNSIIG